MKLIIGLGNPGEKYKNTRHNVGHMVIDKFKTQNAKVKIMVVKTKTFMNESGDFVKKLVEQYRVDMPNLWIIHDDLDIPLGSYKIQKGRGPKEHKGLASINESLGTSDYWHVRIGVDNRDPNNRISGEEYVLQDFSPDETAIINNIINEVCKKLVTS